MKKGQKIIIANWKMHPESLKDARILYKRIALSARRLKKVHTIICPPFVYLHPLTERKNALEIGAQNFFHEPQGAYTGEVSADMVKNMGASYVIIGHSERRALGETDEIMNKKVHLALSRTITPIICIGEKTRDEEGHYFDVVKEQIEKILRGVVRSSLSKIILVYEPVWAVGAKAAMEPHDIHQMKIFIMKTLVNIYKTKPLGSIPILYGGSVDASNASEIFSHGQVDGLLIGRVSLDHHLFSTILTIANTEA